MNTSDELLKRGRAKYVQLSRIASNTNDPFARSNAKEGMNILMDIFGDGVVNPQTTKFKIGQEVIGERNDIAPAGHIHYRIVAIDNQDGMPPIYVVRPLNSRLHLHINPVAKGKPGVKAVYRLEEHQLHEAPKFKYGDLVKIADSRHEYYERYLDVRKAYAISAYVHNGKMFNLFGLPASVRISADDLELVQSFPREETTTRIRRLH